MDRQTKEQTDKMHEMTNWTWNNTRVLGVGAQN